MPGTDAFGVNYGNTNNFPVNRSKAHKINILVLPVDLTSIQISGAMEADISS